MNELQNKNDFTSLELVDLINRFRTEEGNRSELSHNDFLKVLRDEFDEEIGQGNISYTPYTHPQNKQKYPMYILNLSQSRQVLVRESKFVRKAVIAYIDKLENELIKTLPHSDLSPQLQLLINMELKQKQIEQSVIENKQEIQDMRDVIQLSTSGWRTDAANLINKIAVALGGFEHIRDVRAESYKLLDERMGVDVNTRLTNKRRRMAEEGISKSKREKTTVLDIIAEDKKLVEGYIAIVKEMAIKYRAA